MDLNCGTIIVFSTENITDFKANFPFGGGVMSFHVFAIAVFHFL